MRESEKAGMMARAPRVLAALLALGYLAALACLAVHHHAIPHDTAPCLVCAAASAPAAPPNHAPASTPPAEPEGLVLSTDESVDPFFLFGSTGIRAPPAA